MAAISRCSEATSAGASAGSTGCVTVWPRPIPSAVCASSSMGCVMRRDTRDASGVASSMQTISHPAASM